MQGSIIKGRIILKAQFPYVDFHLKETASKDIAEFLKLLESKFSVFKKLSIMHGGERVEGALITSRENALIATIFIDYESSLFQEGFLKLTLMYSPTKEGKEVLELFKEIFKERLIPYFHILLKVVGRWGNNNNYVLDPEEFTKNLIPELFFGIDAQKLAESFLRSHQNILMLFGKPGTGKSKLIQYIIGQSTHILRKPVSVLVIKGEKNIIDSATQTALAVKMRLKELNLLSNNDKGEYFFNCSDSPEHFMETGNRFLDFRIENVNLVKVWEYSNLENQ
jgi:hypothetical protein